MSSALVKIVVYVPEDSADKVREAMGKAGAGKIGNYSFCSFSTKGIGRYLPNDNANPYIGESGALASVTEERIETICHRDILNVVINAMKAVHPYEEVAFDVYALEDYK
jgi:hypothetical protein